MTANTEMTNTEWAIEAAARAMYVARHWTRAITEPEDQVKPKEYYEEIAGRWWDSGNAGYSLYQEFRAHATAAVPAATPGILAEVADKVESARIDAGPASNPIDRLKPLLRVADFSAWLRREATAPARAEFLKPKIPTV